MALKSLGQYTEPFGRQGCTQRIPLQAKLST
jgi:hypothetical protein